MRRLRPNWFRVELGVNPSNLDSEPKLLTIGLCSSEGSSEKKSQQGVCVFVYLGIKREVYFKELASVIVEAGKSKIRRVRPAGWRRRERLMQLLKSESQLLAEFTFLRGGQSFFC